MPYKNLEDKLRRAKERYANLTEEQKLQVKEKKKELNRKYRERPEVKEKQKEYNKRPEVKEKRKEYVKRYRQKLLDPPV